MMSLLWFSFNFQNVLIILTSVSLLWLYHRLTFWQRQNVPQSLQHLAKLITGPMHLVDQKLIQEKGKIVGSYEVLSPTLFLAEPKLIYQVLVTNFSNFSHHRTWSVATDAINQNMFSLPHQRWRPLRFHVLAPLFTLNNLKKMLPLMESAVDGMIGHLKRSVNNQNNNAAEFDVKPILSGGCMDVAMRCIFGLVIDSVSQPDNPILSVYHKIFGTDVNLTQILSFLFPNFFYKLFRIGPMDIRALYYIANYCQRLIEERQSLVNNNHRDILQLMIDIDNQLDETNGNKSKKLTTDEIIANCVLFSLAGFEPISITVTSTVYYLAKNTDVQELVADEIKNKLDSDVIDYEKLIQLKNLDAFIKESMRLNPINNRIERVAVVDCYLDDIFIPKNTIITMPTYFVHHDSDNYPEPEKFIIDRFYPENKKNVKPGTYLPFADGPRNCFGKSFALLVVKVCLVKLLRKFKFVATDKTKFEPHIGRLMLMPKKMVVKVEMRNKLN